MSLLDKLKKCKFDEIYIDSNSKIIEKFCQKNNFNEYNFSSSTVKTVEEIYDLICQKTLGEYVEV